MHFKRSVSDRFRTFIDQVVRRIISDLNATGVLIILTETVGPITHITFSTINGLSLALRVCFHQHSKSVVAVIGRIIQLSCGTLPLSPRGKRQLIICEA